MALPGWRSLPFRMLMLWLGGAAVIVLTGVAGERAMTAEPDALQDTYYVVAHWRHIWTLAAQFAGFGVAFYVYPLLARRRYRGWLAVVHFLLTFGGNSLIMAAAYELTLFGPPERYVDSTASFERLARLAVIGNGLVILGIVVLLVTFVEPFIAGRRIAPVEIERG